MNIRQRNFKALAKIVDMEAIQAFNFETAKSESRGYMDLNFDYLFATGDKAVVALSHYYRASGDSVPDPDMEIEIDFATKSVRARTYQDTHTFNDVRETLGPASERVCQSLDRFLSTWLKNLFNQGHRIDTAAIERSKSSHPLKTKQRVDHA